MAVNDVNLNINVKAPGLKDVNDNLDKLKNNLKTGKSSLDVFKGAIGALGVAGIAAKAMDVLTEAFMSNEKVAKLVNTAMTALKLMVNDFVELVSNSIGPVTDFFKRAFEDPLGSIKKLGQAIWDNIMVRINSAMKLFGHFADGIKALFTGDFDKLKDIGIQAGKDYADMLTGVENTIDKVTTAVGKAVDYVGKTWNKAVDIEKQKKDSKELIALLNGQIEKVKAEYAEQKRISEDTTQSYETRIEASKKWREGITKEQALTKQLAGAIVAQAQAEVAVNNTSDTRAALQEAKNQGLVFEQGITERLTEQQNAYNGIIKEQVDGVRSLNETKMNTNFQSLKDNANLIVDELKKNEILKQINDQEKEEQLKRLSDVINATKEGTAERTEAEKVYLQTKQSLESQGAALELNIQKIKTQRAVDLTNQKLANDQLELNNKKTIASSLLLTETERINKQKELLRNEFSEKQKILEESYKLELAAAESAGLDTSEIKRKYELQKTALETEQTEKSTELSNRERDNKLANLQIISGALNGLTSLIGENTVAGKGLAVAQATIDTYTGATKALAQGGIFGKIAAVGIIASGLANVKKIISTKIPGKDSASGGSVGSAPSTPSFSAPQMFGIGGNLITNPAELQAPQRVYVTEGDITRTQGRVRVIQDSAILGG